MPHDCLGCSRGAPMSPRDLTSAAHGPATLLFPQLARYTKEGFLHLGALGTTTLLPDTRCLVDNAKSRLPQLLDCDKVKSSLYKRWNFIQVSPPRTGWAGSLEQVRMPRASPGRAATECNPRSPSLRPDTRLKACSGGSQEPFPLSSQALW